LLVIENLLPVVTSLLAFSHYANQDFDKVLKTLDDRVCSQGVGFNDLYLNGEHLLILSHKHVSRAFKIKGAMSRVFMSWGHGYFLRSKLSAFFRVQVVLELQEEDMKCLK